MKLYSLGILSLFFALSASAAKPKLPKDAILLSNVKSLTLRAGAKTSHRRVSAIPQLTCQGPGCKHHTVDIMRCQNMGSDYEEEDIQWSCTASLPEDFKLGATEVACEGYKSSDDPAVLKGSCGVTYRLLLTDKGEEKYGTTWWGGSKSSSNKGFDKGRAQGEGTDYGGWLFMILFVGVLLWIVFKFLTAVGDAPGARRPRQWGGNWGHGWGGGGGGGGWDDPPPPYSRKNYYGGEASQGWRPGFWSGTAAGAAAGYAAGAARGNRAETREVPRTGGWFGGGGGGSRNSNWGESPSRSNSGSSSARYESTGFGSTSRR